MSEEVECLGADATEHMIDYSRLLGQRNSFSSCGCGEYKRGISSLWLYILTVHVQTATPCRCLRYF